MNGTELFHPSCVDLKSQKFSFVDCESPAILLLMLINYECHAQRFWFIQKKNGLSWIFISLITLIIIYGKFGCCSSCYLVLLDHFRSCRFLYYHFIIFYFIFFTLQGKHILYKAWSNNATIIITIIIVTCIIHMFHYYHSSTITKVLYYLLSMLIIKIGSFLFLWLKFDL
jgi:hypothetical protein